MLLLLIRDQKGTSAFAKARGFGDADDIAAVLHYRLARAIDRPTGSGRGRGAPRFISGLIPKAVGPMTAEMQKALTERRELIQQRADVVLDQALQEGEEWVVAIGEEPGVAEMAVSWRRQTRTIAAYRDRYDSTGKEPLGEAPGSDAQKIDAARASAALVRPKGINTQQAEGEVPPCSKPVPGPLP